MKKLYYLLFLAGTLLLSLSNYAQTTTNSNGELVMNKDSLMKFLFKYNFEHYSVAPNIPNAFIEKKEKYEIPADEEITAFIDASVMENGKFGIAIGLKGLYIFNSKTANTPGRIFLPYSSFKLSEVTHEKKDELRIGPVYIDIVGLMKVDQNKAEEFFKDLKSKLLK
jgi:hypothetical protein